MAESAEECWTLDHNGQRVTAHSHYRSICHAYPGPNGEVVVDGHVFSVPLERHVRGAHTPPRPDPDTFPKPPCPACGTPCDITWADVSTLGTVRRDWLPVRLECPAGEHHDVASAYPELSWPADLTDEDRAWLRAMVA